MKIINYKEIKKDMFKICSKKEFIENNSYEAIFCFGAGKWSRFLDQVFYNTAVLGKVNGFIDNDISKSGSRITVGTHRYRVYSPEIFKIYRGRKIAVIITCSKMMEVLNQLKKDVNLYNADFYYIHHFELADIEAKAMQKEIPDDLKRSSKMLIPKVIHYCWFGGGDIPDKYKAWMESWEKYCPDYKIQRWDESNYDITKNKYMLQAYENKKWGFVPDYARLDIIYNHGGIYLDTDVELISNFDELLYQKGFAGFETEQYVNLGSGFGAVPRLNIIKEMLDYYEDKSFINDDGSLNMIASPRLQTGVLLEHGLKQDGEYQVVDEMTIFPEKMFCGKNERLRRILLKPYSKSIHHYDGSWMEDENRKINDDREALLQEKELVHLQNERNATNSQKEKLSVVIIIYNVINYLDACIESVLKQSYKNIEIILVDDGSTDGSGEKCDIYSQKNENIKVIHKKNEGLVSARREGAKCATGEYIAFVDGDDWIEENMYETLKEYADAYKVDVVLSGIIRNFPNQTKVEHNLVTNGYYSKKELEEDIYPKMMFSMKEMNHYVDPSLCNKLFRTEIIMKALLEEDADIFYLGEDAAATYPCLLDAQSIFVTDKAFYHHRIVETKKENLTYKNEQVYERLEKFYSYLESTFEKTMYNRIMKPQLIAYYMVKLNQVTSRNIGVDFLQFYRNSLQYAMDCRQVKYELPKEIIPENCNIVLYGAGAVGKDYDVQLRAYNYKVVAWVDKNAEELKNAGWPVKKIDDLKKCKYDVVLIATKKEPLYMEMKKELIKRGVEEEKIIWACPVERN